MGIARYAVMGVARSYAQDQARRQRQATRRAQAPKPARMTPQGRAELRAAYGVPQAGAAVAVPVAADPEAPIAGTVTSTRPAGVQPYKANGLEITGDEWLRYMKIFFSRYVYWPSEASCDAAVLWAAHTYLRESPENGAGLMGNVSPRFFALSSERNSGKSTVMALFLNVCPRAFGIDTQPTEYGLLESIETEKPTLLIDELGILIQGDKRSANVQQILLNGYTPRGTKLRQKDKKANRVSLFAPIALAGLDVVEKTASENIKAILSRGVIVHMRPAPDNAEPHDLDEEEDEVERMVRTIRIAGMGWTITNREYLRNYRPEPAEGAHRRWRQIWRPMLTIADAAGGDWPERARKACVELQHGFAGADDEQMKDLAGMKDELAASFPGM